MVRRQAQWGPAPKWALGGRPPPRREHRVRDAAEAESVLESKLVGTESILEPAEGRPLTGGNLAVQSHPESVAVTEAGGVVEEPSGITLATLFKFTLPTLAIWLINPSLSLVDTAVVGMQSSNQLAALGPGCILCDMNGYVFTFIAVATTNLMAVSIANNNQEQAAEILSDAIGIALLLGLLFGVATYALCPLMLAKMTGNASSVLAPAAEYVKIRCFGAPATFIMFVTNAFFLAAWDPMTPLRSALLSGAVNLGLDVLLVTVFGWGIAGAAIATVAAQVAVAASLLWSIRKPLPEWSPIHSWRLKIRWRVPGVKAIARFLFFAGPICFVLLTKSIMYNRLGSYSSSLGAVPSAASHVIFTVFGFFAVFGDVVSQAAQTFMPATISQPQRAQDLGKKLFLTGAGVGIVNSGIAAGIVVFLPWLFTRNVDVMAASTQLAPLMAGCLSVHTASLATEGMLLAGRDLTFLVISYVANMTLTVASLELVKHHALGVLGSYLCLFQFQATRLLLNSARLCLAGSSPLRSTTRLDLWLAKDAKAATA